MYALVIIISSPFIISNLGPDSIERQMRLVGDLAFLLQNYELAYSMHHTLKRDLQGRDLWIHYAGAHVSFATCTTCVVNMLASTFTPNSVVYHSVLAMMRGVFTIPVERLSDIMLKYY